MAVLSFSTGLIQGLWKTRRYYIFSGTNSWLHDTESHKNFAPDFFLKVFMLNTQEIWSFDSHKNY